MTPSPGSPFWPRLWALCVLASLFLGWRWSSGCVRYGLSAFESLGFAFDAARDATFLRLWRGEAQLGNLLGPLSLLGLLATCGLAAWGWLPATWLSRRRWLRLAPLLGLGLVGVARAATLTLNGSADPSALALGSLLSLACLALSGGATWAAWRAEGRLARRLTVATALCAGLVVCVDLYFFLGAALSLGGATGLAWHALRPLPPGDLIGELQVEPEAEE